MKNFRGLAPALLLFVALFGPFAQSSAASPVGPFKECHSVNPENVVVSQNQYGWGIVEMLETVSGQPSGAWRHIDLAPTKELAEKAVQDFLSVGFNQYCIVEGPGGFRFQFHARNGKVPTRAPKGAHCFGFDWARASVGFEDGKWRILEGNKWVMESYSKESATGLLAAARKLALNRHCYLVPKQQMYYEYWLSGPPLRPPKVTIATGSSGDTRFLPTKADWGNDFRHCTGASTPQFYKIASNDDELDSKDGFRLAANGIVKCTDNGDSVTYDIEFIRVRMGQSSPWDRMHLEWVGLAARAGGAGKGSWPYDEVRPVSVLLTRAASSKAVVGLSFSVPKAILNSSRGLAFYLVGANVSLTIAFL